MKALLTAAVVMIAVQPAFAQQPRTPAEVADCYITESIFYRAKLNREYPEPKNGNDPLFAAMKDAIANAIASKCSAAR